MIIHWNLKSMQLSAVLALLLLTFTFASESPYQGKISLMPYGKYTTSTQICKCTFSQISSH